MKVHPIFVRLMLNFFPPLFFNRIKVIYLSTDFKKMTVQVRHSLWNRNLNKSIFGGTIFSAGDPFFAIMYWQYFEHQGMKTEAWLKEATIRYKKPATSKLIIHYELTDQELKTATDTLLSEGKCQQVHTISVKDVHREEVASIRTVSYLKLRKST